jgi:hypothetical protein
VERWELEMGTPLLAPESRVSNESCNFTCLLDATGPKRRRMRKDPAPYMPYTGHIK